MESDARLLERLIAGYGLVVTITTLGIAALVTLGWQFLKASVERRATAAIDRELDAYRTKLQLSADAVRFDFQRRMADFDLYNSQRHRLYRRIFRRALEAEGAFAGLIGGFLGNDYSRADKSQIAMLLGSLRTPGEVRDEILVHWDQDRNHANRKLDQAIRKSREAEANHFLQQFKNDMLLGDIYVSKEVRLALGQLNEVLAKMSAYAFSPADTETSPFELKTQAATRVTDLREAMARDLSRGDYGKTVGTTLNS
jgi:hypothetical protein